MSKTIKIMRNYAMIDEAQSDPEVQRWLGLGYKGVGSYWEGKSVASGLTFEEQEILLPRLLGIESTDLMFRKTVEKYFTEFNYNVPPAGVTLKVSLKDDTRELAPSNMPENLDDYIKYKHALKNPAIAKNELEAKRNPQIYSHYFVDLEAIASEKTKLNTIEDQALALYFQLKDDEVKTDQVLSRLGERIDKLTRDQRRNKLKELATKPVNKSTAEQEAALHRFIKIATDKHLEMSFLIDELIGLQYLRRAGQAILFSESGEKIGDNMEEAVLFFNNPKNSKEYNLAKATYTNKSKQTNADKYLPQGNPVSIGQETTPPPPPVKPSMPGETVFG